MNSRNLKLDFIKLLAMCGVMCLHTQMRYIDSPIAHFLYITAVVSVPLFFMTSGYLLLGKENVDYKYSGKKILGILRFVIIMTVLFYFLSGIRHGSSFIDATLGSLIQKGQLGVYWYFGAMIIIYALLPILNVLFCSRFKVFISIVISLFVISSAVFVLNFTNGIHIEQNTIQTFRLWNWLFYFCLGGLLKRFTFHVSGYAVLFLIIINYLFQINTFHYIDSEFCEYFYPSIPVMLLSVSVFQCIRHTTANLNFVNGGGKLFLPCYTIHIYVIGKAGNVFEEMFSFAGIFCPVFFWILVCVLSIMLSWIIMKVPYAEKVFRI